MSLVCISNHGTGKEYCLSELGPQNSQVDSNWDHNLAKGKPTWKSLIPILNKVNYTYRESLSLEGKVISFKSVDLLNVQSSATKLKIEKLRG